MATINKKFSQLLYAGTQPLTLANLPSATKQQIKLIRQVNSAGTGYASFNPASGVNSLTQVTAGTAQAHVIVEASSSTPNFDLADFAVALSGGGGGGSDTIQLSGPAGVTVSEYEESFTATSAAVPTVVFTSGTGTVQYSTNSGASWAALPGSIPAGTAFMLRVQHTAAFSATITLTY